MAIMIHDYYRYKPSVDAAIVVAVLYSLAFTGTFLQFLRYRSWVWTVMVLASGSEQPSNSKLQKTTTDTVLVEAAGYIARVISAKNVDNKDLYIIQFTLVVLAPVLMAAACYIVFVCFSHSSHSFNTNVPTQGRIVFHVVPKEARTTRLLWIPPRFVTPIFVACDVRKSTHKTSLLHINSKALVALLLQLWGAVQITSVTPGQADAVSKANKGKKIAQIGVAIQLACFGLFSIIAVRFNFTSKRFAIAFEQRLTNINEKYCTIDGTDHKLKKNWQAILRVTNIASLCILIRSVYRMVDFSLGRTGYTQSHEWCVYIFDSLVIFPVVVLYVHWHPSKYLPYLGFRLPKHAR
jgi:hypothetical protein